MNQQIVLVWKVDMPNPSPNVTQSGSLILNQILEVFLSSKPKTLHDRYSSLYVLY